MDVFEKLARFGNFSAGTIEAEPDDRESVVYRGMSGQAKLKQIALDFYRKVQEIRSDTRMTAEGHSDHIKAAATKALAQLDAADKLYFVPIEKRLSELRTEFKFDSMPADDIPATLREIEVRGLLLSLVSSERYEALRSAIDSKDVMVFRAFNNAPLFLNLMNPKIMAQCRQTWAERLNPRISKELAEVETTCSILASSFDETYQGIGELGQIIDDSMRVRLQGIAQTGLDTAAASFERHRLARETTDTAGNKMDPNLKVLNTGK